MNIYAVKNKKVGFWLPPFFKNEPPQAIATEQYRLIATDLERAKKGHLEELVVYQLGEFDDISGEFKIFDKPIELIDNQEVMYKLQEQELAAKNEG